MMRKIRSAIPKRHKKEHPEIVTGSFGLHFEDVVRRNNKTVTALLVTGVLLLAIVVPVAVYRSIAATGAASLEAESGTRSVSVTTVTDNSASGGSYVQFGSGSGSAGYVFPLKVGADRHHLVDQNNKPYLLIGDAGWSLEVGPDNAGVVQYLNDRQAKGFTGVLMEFIEHQFDSHGAPLNADGNAPFTTPGDFSTPNEAYWAHVDYVVQQAEQRNIALFVTPVYLGYPGTQEGWYNELIANGNTKALNFGKYLGNRYKNNKNIVWVMGGDSPPMSALTEIEALVQGIQQTTAAPIFTAHNSRSQSGITQYPVADQSWLTVNSTYSNCTLSPGELNTDYTRSPAFPTFLIEAWYENEHNTTPVCIRSQAWWSVLEGGFGHMFGNNPIWLFDPGWQTALNSQGSNDMARMGRVLRSRDWGSLVPDTTHTTLTAGYGSIGDGSYVAAARTGDGNTVVIYSPGNQGLTINMTRISGTQAHGWWYNPGTGAVTDLGSSATTGSKTYTPPGSGDWVLILDNVADGNGTPG